MVKFITIINASLHKFVCVLFILHIISRSLCIGCGYKFSYLVRGGMKIKILSILLSIVYCAVNVSIGASCIWPHGPYVRLFTIHSTSLFQV